MKSLMDIYRYCRGKLGEEVKGYPPLWSYIYYYYYINISAFKTTKHLKDHITKNLKRLEGKYGEAIVYKDILNFIVS